MQHDYGMSSGHIQVIFGPMFSGKSTELIRRLRRYLVAQRRCLIIKYKADQRYAEGEVATHDKTLIEAHPCERLSDIEDLARNADVIGIDECQFFDDLVPFCETMANEGKIVVAAGLDGTFQRKPFNHVLELIPLAEHLTKLSAVCQFCHKPAAFSKRISEETAVEVIGGADKYVAVCRACFHGTPDAVTPKKESALLVHKENQQGNDNSLNKAGKAGKAGKTSVAAAALRAAAEVPVTVANTGRDL